MLMEEVFYRAQVKATAGRDTRCRGCSPPINQRTHIA
jgi:hypothetical protein